MATNQDKVKELIDLRNQAKLGGGEKRIESQHKKGIPPAASLFARTSP